MRAGVRRVVGTDERHPETSTARSAERSAALVGDETGMPSARRSVAKVSHTLAAPLAGWLEAFAFYQRVSESSVIEHSLELFFGSNDDDAVLGERLRRAGAGRRRKTND